ncbi:Ubiquitin carboxyl-terminal hydrolase family protein [Babesia bovis T2Bo]|uniref:Ubiquitin carboxyl-terminal hydrolase family protein n=1 Tax=Babesia bovis T2Bo TaxID=484906 RepID=UPI001C357159|nr:Ubiquitin carboxyl-terminal hydrolase family protein [Babesia bovis T2Bo]KAG6440028.1 Ubiquitin carboxyl-terminal hydrolase family protein [Babesia bovis T2Bo]
MNTPKRLCGLTNEYNNSYCNAVIQCLYSLSFVRDALIYMQNSYTLASRTLGRLYLSYDSPSGIQSPNDLLAALGYINGDTSIGILEDAHEFCIYLLNTIIDETRALGNHGYSLGPFNEVFGTISDSVPDIIPLNPVPRTWINSCFEGTLRSEIKCRYCGRAGYELHHFLSLSVDIIEGCDVLSCIQQYTEWSSVSPQDQYQCTSCGCHGCITRRDNFELLPPVLIIRLNRFILNTYVTNDDYLYFYERLPYPVVINRNFDIEDMYHADPVSYTLFAIVSHFGDSPYEGHYMASTYIEGQWYRCDDDRVSVISNLSAELGIENSSGNAHSYILFYRSASIG